MLQQLQLNKYYTKASALARAYPLRFGAAALVALGLLYYGYTLYQAQASTPKYVLTEVRRGTISETISASGQVSASATLSLKSKASGDVISLSVSPGDQVVQGQRLLTIDPTNAQKTVRDAEVSLESAQIALEKLTRPTEKLTLIQSQNALTDATANAEKAYDDGFTTVSNAFLSLPTTMAGLENVLYGYDLSPGRSQSNASVYTDLVNSSDGGVLVYRNDAEAKYAAARSAYEATFLKYRALTRTSSQSQIESLVTEAYVTSKLVGDAVKSTNDFLGFVKDRLTIRNLSLPATLSTHVSQLSTYTSSTNSSLQSLLTAKNAFSTTRATLAEKTQSLADLQDGSDSLDIKSAELNVTRAQNTLRDAMNTLADYYVRAPFAGTVATLPLKRYDSASNGSVLATIITSKKVAELSLNEVDAAKVSVGDAVSLTFDALDGLEVEGVVAEVDAVGTVSQGVVSYAVTIGFEVEDERIKSGMTVNASIVTETREDALIVPSSAVKSEKGESYVLAFEEEFEIASSSRTITTSLTPTRIKVETGIADDSRIEILRGLKVGQQVIARTVTTNTTTTSTTRRTGGPPF